MPARTLATSRLRRRVRTRPGRAPATRSPWKKPEDRLRERELKREAVLLAAAEAFNRRGYHNTSLDDIARRLNVTKPTIYYYVSNKEEILYQCFRMGIDEINAALDESEQGGRSGLDKLTMLMRKYAETLTTEIGLCTVRVEDHDLSPPMRQRIKELKSRIDRRFRAFIEEGLADGSLMTGDPKMAGFAIAGALNWIGHWYHAEDGLHPHEIIDRFIELFLNGLRPRRQERAGNGPPKPTVEPD